MRAAASQSAAISTMRAAARSPAPCRCSSLPGAVGTTLDSLFVTQRNVGCVAVRGRAEPDLLDPLISRRCLLFHVSAMVVHARDKALLAEVRGSRALLTGLAGETWTRLVGGEFA